jgi:hypothetical protein
METESQEFRKIEDRCRELKKWILTNAPHIINEERHLVEGSQERAYWSHGYLSALLDVVRLFSRDTSSQQPGNGDTTQSRHAA